MKVGKISSTDAGNCKMISYLENSPLVSHEVRQENTIWYAYYITQPFISSFVYLYSCSVT